MDNGEEMPLADPALLASANRMLSDRLAGVAHVLRGSGLPALADIDEDEDLQPLVAALSGAYQMARSELHACEEIIHRARALCASSGYNNFCLSYRVAGITDELSRLRHRLQSADDELAEASEALIRVIGDDTSVDTSDLSLAALVGEVEHIVTRLRHIVTSTPADPAYPTLQTYDAGPYQVRVGALYVQQPDDTILSELTTTVRLADEAAGEFVEVEQSGRTDIGKIAICRDEWPALRQAIDMMIAQCRGAK